MSVTIGVPLSRPLAEDEMLGRVFTEDLKFPVCNPRQQKEPARSSVKRCYEAYRRGTESFQLDWILKTLAIKPTLVQRVVEYFAAVADARRRRRRESRPAQSAAQLEQQRARMLALRERRRLERIE